VAFAGRPLLVKSASRLLAFHVPPVAGGRVETGPRTLTVQVDGQATAQRVVVPAALKVPASSHVTLTHLSPHQTYELTPRLGTPPARLRPGAPPLSRLVLGTREGVTVVPLGEPARLRGVDSAFFTVFDDAAAPTGLVEILVREVPAQQGR
jgi:hypothetical protein